MSTQSAARMQLAEEAAEWVMRRLEDRSAECNAEFLRWLKDSPHHIDEFMMAAATYASLRECEPGESFTAAELLLPDPTNVVSFSGNLPEGTPVTEPLPLPGKDRRSLRPGAWMALAASVVVAAGAWMSWYWLDGSYSTGIGEQRMVRLEDGSVVHLNTRSKIQVDFSGTARKLRLIEGEAFFTVVKDSTRPFTVLTHDAAVRVLGTEFNVYERQDETRIAVLEGEVRVSTHVRGSQPQQLRTGEQADVHSNGSIIRRTSPDMSTALSWRQRQLVFRNVPLAAVAEEFNRYNDYQIHIEDENLRRRLIGGIFPVDDPHALEKFLAQDRSIRLTRTRTGLTAAPAN